MTNEMIEHAVQRADDQALQTIVCDGGPMWPHIVTTLWMLLLLVAPILSIVLCIRAWRLRREGRQTGRAPRIILAAALLVIVTTIVVVLESLSHAAYLLATSPRGAAFDAMVGMNISRDCIILLIGVVVSSLCLLCALCLPISNSDKEPANKASHATSEPAPNADSSSHGG